MDDLSDAQLRAFILGAFASTQNYKSGVAARLDHLPSLAKLPQRWVPPNGAPWCSAARAGKVGTKAMDLLTHLTTTKMVHHFGE